MRFFHRSAFCSLIFFFVAKSAAAFSLSPAIQELAIRPGSAATSLITITNDTAVEKTFYLMVQKFLPEGENGGQSFLPLEDTSGLPSWIFFDRASFALKPAESRQIRFTVRVPATASSGGYYAAIFFSDQPPLPSARGLIAHGARTGELLLVTVPGSLVSDLRVAEFRTLPPVARGAFPSGFSFLLENDGNAHVLPQGFIEVKNMLGQIRSSLAFNEKNGRVLPNSRRRFDVLWHATGGGFFENLKNEWADFGLGLYIASPVMQTPPLKGTVPVARFFVFPWRLGSLALGVLVTFYFASRFFRRRRLVSY